MTIKELEKRVVELEIKMKVGVLRASGRLNTYAVGSDEKYLYTISYQINGEIINVTGWGKSQKHAAKDARGRLARKLNEMIFYPTLTVCEDI